MTFIALAGAQPTERPRGTEPPIIDRAQLRERLASRLERSKASHDALVQAIARLDAGEETGSVLTSLGPVLREELPGIIESLRQRGPASGGPHAGPGIDRIEVDPQAIEAFIEREIPWLSERLNKAEAERPGSRAEMIRRLTPQVEEILNTSRENPQLAELYIVQFRLGSELIDTLRRVRRAIEAGEQTEDQARSVLRELATQHVMVREKITRSEIDSLRARLAEREAELNAQIEDRDRIIASMTDRMMSRGIEWRRGDPSSRGPRRGEGQSGDNERREGDRVPSKEDERQDDSKPDKPVE
jgi:hypothetical protein